MTYIGTSHFISFKRANEYYAQYVPALSDVEVRAWVRDKVKRGEIHIGPPVLRRDDMVMVNGEGRFVLVGA